MLQTPTLASYSDNPRNLAPVVTATPASIEAVFDRIRDMVARRPVLADLLACQAANLPLRVFGAGVTWEQFLEIYLEEAKSLFELITPRLRLGLRVLEVGGGLGFFHVLARAHGVDIVSLEPSEAGFSVFRDFGKAMLAELTGEPERFVDARLESFSGHDGAFDLIVSNNVLEHVDDPYGAIRDMYRMVVPGGVLLHSCPNYLVPYEPHYKVPIIPCNIRLSGALLWWQFRRDPLWKSLNNIHAFGIMREVTKLRGGGVIFHNAFGAMLDRLAQGGPLARRHGWIARLALSRPVRALTAKVPPQFLTPMVFEITKGQCR